MPTPQQYAQVLGSGIRPYSGTPGLSPGGLRHSGMAPKGMGFFGPIATPTGDVSTEISVEEEMNGQNVEFPLLVPTLSADELSGVVGGNSPSPDVLDKARSHALARILRGLSPFAGPQDLRFPQP